MDAAGGRTMQPDRAAQGRRGANQALEADPLPVSSRHGPGSHPRRSLRPPVTLAARLLFAFGLVAILATALVGASVREISREIIEGDFNDRIEAAASGVSQELRWEAEGLRGLLAPLCEHDTFVDKAQLDLDRVKGDVKALDPGRWIAIRHFVPEQASALRLDDLVLVTADGTMLGAV